MLAARGAAKGALLGASGRQRSCNDKRRNKMFMNAAANIGENTFSFLCRLAERTLIILVPTLRGCGSTHTRTPQNPLHPKHPAGAAVVGDSLVVVGVPLTRMRPWPRARERAHDIIARDDASRRA